MVLEAGGVALPNVEGLEVEGLGVVGWDVEGVGVEHAEASDVAEMS